MADTNQLSARVFLHQRRLLKTRFFSRTSRAIFPKAFPADLANSPSSRYASGLPDTPRVDVKRAKV